MIGLDTQHHLESAERLSILLTLVEVASQDILSFGISRILLQNGTDVLFKLLCPLKKILRQSEYLVNIRPLVTAFDTAAGEFTCGGWITSPQCYLSQQVDRFGLQRKLIAEDP